MNRLNKFAQNNTYTKIKEIEKRYPNRELPPNALVTRVAPSPTGFAHIGFIYMSLICREVSKNTDGVFIFRLEDTDQKREIKGSDKRLIEALECLGIQYDEGITQDNKEKGKYGPYRQTDRVPIYQAYVDKLLDKGFAYPCFMTEDELNSIREQQTISGTRPGIYAEYSKWRDASKENVEKLMRKGTPYVIRFKWPAEEEIIQHSDLSGIKYNFDSNDFSEDFVLLKSNGIPTYHLAHLVDDHLMKVNLVIRGNEWVSSLPKHIVLHRAFGFQSPLYYHVPPIEIIDIETGGRRKLSKRKDLEADIFNLLEDGFPRDALKTYLLWIATSEYEKQTIEKNKPIILDFKLDISMLKSGAGSLFDLNRLRNLSRESIYIKTSRDLSLEVLQWSKKYSCEFYNVISKHDIGYLQKSLVTVNNPLTKRKDVVQYSDIPDKIGFLYDEIYENIGYDITSIKNIRLETIETILREFLMSYNEKDSLEKFLQKMKDIAVKHGFSLNKQSTESKNYLGLWSVVPAIIRTAIAKRNISPELHECLRILGRDKIMDRSERLLDYLRRFIDD